MSSLSVLEYMEDFDNVELSDYERDEQLMEAVRNYNCEHDTAYSPKQMLYRYKSWQRQKEYED